MCLVSLVVLTSKIQRCWLAAVLHLMVLIISSKYLQQNNDNTIFLQVMHHDCLTFSATTSGFSNFWKVSHFFGQSEHTPPFFIFFRNRNSGFSVCKDTRLTEVCRSYLDSGRAGRWRGASGSGPSLSYTRSGWWRVFLTPLCGRWWVLGTSGCAGACRDDRGTKTNRWTGKKKGGEVEAKGGRGEGEFH